MFGYPVASLDKPVCKGCITADRISGQAPLAQLGRATELTSDVPTDMAIYMRQRRKARQDRLFVLFGSKCERCGGTDNLEFDHENPALKRFQLSNLNGPWSTILEEAAKCQLLCRPCHIAKGRENGDIGTHGGWNRIDDPVHGTAVMYGHRCRCEACRHWKRLYREGLVDTQGEPR
jgi:hypothetical protein